MKTPSERTLPRIPARVQPSRPALLPHELGMAMEHSIPPDVEPCCDLEWLEREANRLDQLGHDAGHAAARVIRAMVHAMDGHGVWSVADLNAREEAENEAHYQRYLADEAEREADCAHLAKAYVPTAQDEADYREAMEQDLVERRIEARIWAKLDSREAFA
jgi:hypothetical protein